MTNAPASPDSDQPAPTPVAAEVSETPAPTTAPDVAPTTPTADAASTDTPVASAPAEPVADTPAPTSEAVPVAEHDTTPAAEAAAPAEVAPQAEPAAGEAQAEPVAGEANAEPALSEEERAEQARRKQEERNRKEEERKRRDEAFAELEALNTSKARFEVTIQERVKGGLRGDYKGMRVFLPASHYGIRKNVTEDELASALGQTFTVVVHELQSDESGYKSAVVTRRDILLDEFWGQLVPGSVAEGVVTSVTPFGAFVNLGGVEGLVHVSRLSKSRVDNPAEVVKKGDRLTVTIVDVDRDKRKLSLSHKEHEASAWTGVEQTYPVGTTLKGTVRRITDFGAYVQVAPRIEGLLRISELSWTQRLKHPSDVLTVGQEINLQVLEVNEEKQRLALGHKQTLDNPWLSLEQTMPVGTEVAGVVQQVATQGAVVRVADTYDGFMPRSKMLDAGRGQKEGLDVGQAVTCVIVDLDPAAASMILAMKGEDGTIGGQSDHAGEGRYDRGNRGGRGDRGDRGPRGERGDRGDRGGSHERHSAPLPHGRSAADAGGVTLADLISEAQKKNLRKG